MSEHESSERLQPGHRVDAADIRALAGPATPHFALQIRNRIERLIAQLDEADPVRLEGLEQIERLTELADNSGEPRGTGPGSSGH